MKISPWLILLLGIALGVALSYRRQAAPSSSSILSTVQKIEVVYDTVTLEMITPVEVSPLAETEHHTPSEKTKESTLNLYTFRDTLSDGWSAEIVGRDVQFRSLTLHNRTETHNIIQYAQPRWQISTQLQISTLTQWIGVAATHNIGRTQISAHIGVNPRGAQIVYGATIGIALWSRY